MSLKATQNISLDAVFVGLRRLGFTDTYEKDIVEWSGQALELIGCVNQLEEAVCFITVKSHRADLPVGLKAISQIAKNNCYQSKIPQTAVTPQDIVNQYGQSIAPYPSQVSNQSYPGGCSYCSDQPIGYMNQGLQYVSPGPNGSLPGNINTTAFDLNTYVPIPIDCFGEPIDEMSLAYYRPYFDLQYEYSPWTGSSVYKDCFSPVRLATHTFFDTLVSMENNYDGIYHNGISDEYTIVNKKTLKFSFPEGQIALAYTRTALDKETKWPLMPDNASYLNACIYFNIWKLMEKEFYGNREGAENRMKTAEAQWIWYCGQAGGDALMIKGEDEHQNFLDGRNYMLPRLNRYSGFFGKLGTPENRKFNNPDFKNSRVSLFRGYES